MVVVKEILRAYYSCSEDVKFDIDRAISELVDRGMLSEVDLYIINSTKEQYSLSLIGEFLDVDRSSIGRLLNEACKKIADFLGPEYQEDKIIKAAEARLRRKLTRAEKSFCRRKMKDYGRNRYANVNIFNFKEKLGSRRNKKQG